MALVPAVRVSPGELIEAPSRVLFCAGQTATDGSGRPQHEGDIAAQLKMTLDNLEAVLTEAEMSLEDVVRLTVYTTDVDGLMPHYGLLAERLAARGAAPPATLLGVQRLAYPELLIEIEATAVR